MLESAVEEPTEVDDDELWKSTACRNASGQNPGGAPDCRAKVVASTSMVRMVLSAIGLRL